MNLRTLQTKVASGERVEYLFFWGHQPEPYGQVGKGCLSQGWPVRFERGGAVYASSEHHMMAEKARLFGDGATRARILSAKEPAEAKALGRQVRGFEERVW